LSELLRAFGALAQRPFAFNPGEHPRQRPLEHRDVLREQKESTGKNEKIPPRIKSRARGIRTSRDDGFRSHATNRAGPGGNLASNQAKCRSSSILWSTLTELSPSRGEMLIGQPATRRQSVAQRGA